MLFNFSCTLKYFSKQLPLPSQACFRSLPLGPTARARSALHLLHCPLSSGSAHSARPGKSSSVPTHWLTLFVSHFPVNKNRQFFFKSLKYNTFCRSSRTICLVHVFQKLSKWKFTYLWLNNLNETHEYAIHYWFSRNSMFSLKSLVLTVIHGWCNISVAVSLWAGSTRIIFSRKDLAN